MTAYLFYLAEVLLSRTFLRFFCRFRHPFLQAFVPVPSLLLSGAVLGMFGFRLCSRRCLARQPDYNTTRRHDCQHLFSIFFGFFQTAGFAAENPCFCGGKIAAEVQLPVFLYKKGTVSDTIRPPDPVVPFCCLRWPERGGKSTLCKNASTGGFPGIQTSEFLWNSLCFGLLATSFCPSPS